MGKNNLPDEDDIQRDKNGNPICRRCGGTGEIKLYNPPRWIPCDVCGGTPAAEDDPYIESIELKVSVIPTPVIIRIGFMGQELNDSTPMCLICGIKITVPKCIVIISPILATRQFLHTQCARYIGAIAKGT